MLVQPAVHTSLCSCTCTGAEVINYASIILNRNTWNIYSSIMLVFYTSNQKISLEPDWYTVSKSSNRIVMYCSKISFQDAHAWRNAPRSAQAEAVWYMISYYYTTGEGYPRCRNRMYFVKTDHRQTTIKLMLFSCIHKIICILIFNPYTDVLFNHPCTCMHIWYVYLCVTIFHKWTQAYIAL